MVHNAYMAGNSTITLRIPERLKRRLEVRAKNMRRSLSSQVVHDLELLINESPPEGAPGRFLGIFQGGRIPTDSEIAEVRSALWKGRKEFLD